MTKWPMVPLGEVITQDKSYINAPEAKVYPKLSVKLYGKGVVLDTPADGSALKMQRHQIAKAGQIILSEIWGKKGAIGFVPEEGNGALCTSHFFLFDVLPSRISPQWLDYIFKGNYLEGQLNAEAHGTTGYAAVRPKNLLTASIPLPPLAVQERLVEHLHTLSRKHEEATLKTKEIEQESNHLLLSAFHQLTHETKRYRLGNIAPLVRRPAIIDPFAEYPGVSVRSFGKGTFHNPPLQGSDITWEKPQLVHAGDILISNIKAWEGAIAVAQPEDDGRYGSHRYLTFVPIPGMITSRFLCFYLLTAEGLHHVGEVSPGSADRNRTTSAKGLLEIPVPLPDYHQQLWFDELLTKAEAVKRLQAETIAEREALLPAILNHVFNGEEHCV